MYRAFSTDVTAATLVGVEFFFFFLMQTLSFVSTRRCGSVYLGVVVLSVREVCYVYEGYVGSALVLYI